ncbi:neocarzinostatin apoprotein domain-containing protein [Nocardia takedensis]|uniref:neocarzinostatin apoprotein domain-containing protein n=1 Tax=Nocardia takedensis TaxID=259390 RepID=UPI000317D928|nr:neocarzinostatin apoprotein domain-containing protein [Nocardia takedensis]
MTTLASRAARAVYTAAIGVSVLLAPVPASAAPDPAVLHVGAQDGLTENQRITVRGTGFQPNLAAVAVGLCRQGYTNGLRDCDLEGGATFVNIAADGTFPELTLTARTRFAAIDCATQQCVIAAAPLPGSEPDSVMAANSVTVLVGFAGTPFHGGATQTPATVIAATEDVSGPSTPLWFATAALLVIVAGLVFTRPAHTRKTQEEK